MPAAAEPEKSVVLIHGAWVTADSWETFRRPFEAAGYRVYTPTWPFLDQASAKEINRHPPEGFGGLTVGHIVDHLEGFIRTLPGEPLLVGHSFGGLFVQMLLDRGVGRAGVAINPVPIGGVAPGVTSLSAVFPIVARWNAWNRPWGFTQDGFSGRFANTAPVDVQVKVYTHYVIPAPGRIFFQAASWIGTRIDPRRRTQPLLITGSDKDRLVTPYVSRSAYNIQRRSKARTDYKEFPGRSHLLIAEPGWDEVAGYAIDWAETV